MSFYESDNSKKEYSLVPEGEWTATLFDVTPGEYQGHPTLSFQYKLDNNRRLFQNFTFNEKGQKWISWQLGILGLNQKAKELAKGDDTPLVAQRAYLDASSTVLNELVNLKVEHSVWGNKTREKVVLQSLVESEAVSKSAPSVDDSEQLPF